MAEAESYVGRILAGRYRLTEKVNEGGMGAIWRAEHLVLRAPVAVKLIDREMLEHANAVERFMREAQAAASLRSPHVVQILDYGVDVDIPFIVMELLEGETLAERLRRKTRLAPEEAAHLLTHVGRAMARAHDAGIVHRDLKPDNIFIVQNSDEELAKVLDFGVAKVNAADISGQGAKTRTGSLLGTPYYMSPEQVQGNKDVDYRSDLWSLGVIAFECMTGERPFASNGLGDLVLQICVRDMPAPSAFARVPPLFDAWFQRACERDPDLRFQTTREMIDDLRRVLGVEVKGASDSQPELLVARETRATFNLMPEASSDAATVFADPPASSDSFAGPRDAERTVVDAERSDNPELSRSLGSQLLRSGITEPVRSAKFPNIPKLDAPERPRPHLLAWVVVLTLGVGAGLGALVFLRYPEVLARWYPVPAKAEAPVQKAPSARTKGAPNTLLPEASALAPAHSQANSNANPNLPKDPPPSGALSPGEAVAPTAAGTVPAAPNTLSSTEPADTAVVHDAPPAPGVVNPEQAPPPPTAEIPPEVVPHTEAPPAVVPAPKEPRLEPAEPEGLAPSP
ncbi:MAG: protein kinase [Polyangiaceae bacterium]|nr:protein kinase [Polyangiaceae bacterium]